MVVLLHLVVGLLLIVVAAGRLTPAHPRLSAGIAALPLLAAGVLTAYVFGEDSYRDDGTSRWDAYRSPGGALGPMFVLSIVLMVAAAALLVWTGLQGHSRLYRSTALAAGVTALFLLVPTTLGFSLN